MLALTNRNFGFEHGVMEREAWLIVICGMNDDGTCDEENVFCIWVAFYTHDSERCMYECEK